MTKTTTEATAQQIQQWKRQHGETNVFRVEGKGKHAGRVCYLHKPDRKTLSYASSVAQANPLQSTEILINNCWLGGDEGFRTEDDLFLGLSQQMAQLVEIADVELKNV